MQALRARAVSGKWKNHFCIALIGERVEGVSGHTVDKVFAAKESLEQFYSNLVAEQVDRERRYVDA